MKKMDRILKEWIAVTAISLVLVCTLYQIIWPMRVEGQSMEKTFYNGAIVIVYKYHSSQPYNRGDIIVADIKTTPEREKVIKRIIGIEGDHVVIRDGCVMINGQCLTEPYAISSGEDEVDVFVPKGGYFIMGDNREKSKDSRTYGCIFQEDVIGKVIYTVYNGF